MKRRSAPPYGPYGSGRTLRLLHVEMLFMSTIMLWTANNGVWCMLLWLGRSTDAVSDDVAPSSQDISHRSSHWSTHRLSRQLLRKHIAHTLN